MGNSVYLSGTDRLSLDDQKTYESVKEHENVIRMGEFPNFLRWFSELDEVAMQEVHVNCSYCGC